MLELICISYNDYLIRGDFKVLNKDSLWQKLSTEFRKNTTDLTYDTWIKPVTPVDFDGSTLTLSLPSELHRDYWKEQLAPNLIEYAFVITKGNIEPKFILDSDIKKESTKKRNRPKPTLQLTIKMKLFHLVKKLISTQIIHLITLLSVKEIRWHTQLH